MLTHSPSSAFSAAEFTGGLCIVTGPVITGSGSEEWKSEKDGEGDSETVNQKTDTKINNNYVGSTNVKAEVWYDVSNIKVKQKRKWTD